MPELIEIKGIGPALAKACAAKGYGSVETVAAAVLNDLVAVPGISEAKAKLVIEAARDLLNQTLNQTPPSNSEASSLDVAPEAGEGEKLEASKKKDKKEKKKKTKKNKKKDKKKKGKKKTKKGKKS